MKTQFINLTQHQLTTDQIAEAEGKRWEVLVMSTEEQELVKELITFDELPNGITLRENARRLAALVKDLAKGQPCVAMIGGAPFFQAYLEKALFAVYCQPVYAFSKRVVVETTDEAGEVVKTAKFVHEGFVPASEL